MASEKKLPLQQGNLDWLCSVYAAINALYLSTENNGWPEGEEKGLKLAEDIFKYLMKQVHLEGNLYKSITAGIDPKDIEWLVDQTRGFWNRKYGNYRLEMVSKDAWVEFPDVSRLKSHLGQGQVILKFEREDGFSHYSVVRNFSENDTIVLYDSYGINSLDKRDNSYFMGPKKTDVVSITDAFLI